MAGVDFLIFLALDEVRDNDPHIKTLDLCTRSLVRQHPEATIHVLTNEVTAHHLQNTPVQPIVCMMASENLLFDRAKLYLNFLENRRSRHNLILIDYDMICVHPLHWIFELEFDLGITFRVWNARHPVNGGFVAVPAAALPAATRIYDRIVSLYDRIEDLDERRWYGDQTALAEALTPHPDPLRAGVYHDAHGARIAWMPTERINYTPLDGWPPEAIPPRMNARMLADLRARDLVHFKGPRKVYMPEFFRRVFSDRYA